MANFHYRALSAAGDTVTGLLEAPSREHVIHHVRGLGHYPISARIAFVDWQARFARLLPRPFSLSHRQLSLATHELAALLEAGVEIDAAIEMLLGMGELKGIVPSLKEVLLQVREGSSLGDALEAQGTFSKFYVSLVRSGEWGGNLAGTLKKLAEDLERAESTREAIRSALVYPIVLLSTAGFSIGFLLLFVLPTFENLFADADAKLPLITRLVIDLSHFLKSAWWALVLVALGTALLGRRALANAERRRKLDRFLLSLPLLGGLVLKIELGRFCRTLGALIQGGVPLPTALGIASATLSNTALAQTIEHVGRSLKEGEGLAGPLSREGLFPAMTTDVIRVGETTGKLDRMLLHHAELLERNARHLTDRLLTLLVPAMTILLGLIVGGLIASMLVAILSVNDLAL